MNQYATWICIQATEFIVEEITLLGTLLELGKQINLGKRGQNLERDYFLTSFLKNELEYQCKRFSQWHACFIKKRFDFQAPKDETPDNAIMLGILIRHRNYGVKTGHGNKRRLETREKMRLGDLAGNGLRYAH